MGREKGEGELCSCKFSLKNTLIYSDGFPEQAERGRQTRLGWGKQATF